MSKNNKKIMFIHFHITDFTVNNFTNKIINNFKLNTTYSLLFKISSFNNLEFKMCGPQIGLVLGDNHDLDYYSNIFKLIENRIDSTLDLYNYIETIDSLEISYFIINPQKELLLKNISQYSMNRQNTNISTVKKNFNQNLLPLTTNESYYGFNIINEERLNYIQLINKNITLSNKDFNITDSDKLFIYETPNNKNKFIIISKQLDVNNFVRYIFDYATGLFVIEIKDSIFLDDKNNNLFSRSIGNVTITVKDNKVLFYKLNVTLHPIKKDFKINTERNINIGAFDLETFRDTDNLAKVYALGFYSYQDENPKLYYISDNPTLNSEELILECIDAMLTNRYNNSTFYVHNLGRYDIYFLYNTLLKININKGYEFYHLKTTMRDNTILKLDIIKNIQTSDNNFRKIKISLVDSLNLLNYSLDKLTSEFNIEFKKGVFPHSFVNRNNFNYIGNKPDIYFYDNLSFSEYQNIPLMNWNLKEECLHYLTKDIKALYLIMEEFSRLLFIKFNTQLTQALTITRLALNIFKRNYYRNINIPAINKYYLFNFIKQGYFGGITEVYKPYGKDLVYIDINSLYPFVALNSMPGTECHFIESYEAEGLNLNTLFGFFYAKVTTNNKYLGLLPVHSNGQVIFPNGKFEGIWSSEELKFAKSKGYDIKVIKGYNFNKVENIFNDYVKDLYDLKDKSTGSFKFIYKNLLNNFLGRFGLSIIKPITQTVNREKKDYICATRKVKSFSFINDNNFLITYDPVISKDICFQHGLDFFKVLEKEPKFNIENNLDLFKDVSIATAAMVTSYARIHINKIKLEILENGGSIYYSDTDSIVLDKTYFNPNWINNKIGFFKLEYDIKEAYFLSNKTYCLILSNGNTIIKAKGVINNSLTVEDFKTMFYENKNIQTKKSNTISNYNKASVLIEKKDIILNYNSYTKREKIYNDKNIWIDTKPLRYFGNKTDIS